MTAPDFWDSHDKSENVINQVSAIKNVLTPFQNITNKFADLEVLAELAEDEGPASELYQEADSQLPSIIADMDKLELMSFLSGPMDDKNAIMTLHSGAGGTEACDWCAMLIRMYTHWFERRGFKYEIVDIQPGDEAGTKSATITVSGDFVYGYLKGEKGVHRLVRISPFDANKRRHTSFVSTDVLPEINDDINIVISDSDLRIDTYHSSGAGGQHINKTDSAVRLTHLKTGVVVACQSERSQHKNKATAMRILKARLYELEDAKRRAKHAEESAAKGDNAWGNQIRSYVLQPYQLIKDLRTDAQTSNINAVLDGDLDLFIDAYLRLDHK